MTYKPITSKFYIDKGHTVVCCNSGNTFDQSFTIDTGVAATEKPV